MKTLYLNFNCFVLFFFGVFIFGQNQPQPSLLNVDGKYLKDDCGENIVLKGLNHGNIYDVSDFGVGEMNEIEKTGSNAVRIVIEREYCTFPPPDYNCVKISTTAVQLTTMIEAALDNDMIPILELHDFTGSNNPGVDLVTAANWWTSPEILDVLLNHQNYLILNIANEPSSSNYPPSGAEQTIYFNANVQAINILRDAGLTCPIMIDSMHWGKDHTFIVNHAENLQNADPLQNLIFSVHTYWPSTGGAIIVTDAQMTSYMQALGNLNVPVVLGEIAHDEVQDGGVFPINYELLLSLCQTYDLGYLIWWWGRIEGGESPLHITTNGLYSGLTADGNVFINSHPNSVKNTAVRPYKLVNGECEDMGIENLENSSIKVYPNPFNDSFHVDSTNPFTKIELYSISGKKLLSSFDSTISTANLPKGTYIIKIYTNKGIDTIKVLKK